MAVAGTIPNQLAASSRVANSANVLNNVCGL
jgi:hypothetical protein